MSSHNVLYGLCAGVAFAKAKGPPSKGWHLRKQLKQNGTLIAVMVFILGMFMVYRLARTTG